MKRQWAVIGAGPAGIAAVGQLLDHGIPGDAITWVDPNFTVGDLGRYWSTVSSNTKVQLFLDFLNACEAFNFSNKPKVFDLETMDPQLTCELSLMVEPLQWVTGQLQKKVACVSGVVSSVGRVNSDWRLSLEGGEDVEASRVILAMGAVPKVLEKQGVEIIPLTTALNKGQLAKAIDADSAVAVYGSSHSAIIIIRYLVELGVRSIVNFYQSPLKYAEQKDGYILYDNTGLKGTTATWAKENIDGEMPSNLLRYQSGSADENSQLKECSKAVYAVGFAPRDVEIEGVSTPISYDLHNGRIAEGLYGFGIGFPRQVTDPEGNVELAVGLWKFMVYLKEVIPGWLG